MNTDIFRGQVLQDVMPQKVDLLDKKILYILSRNCRISNTALAKSLKLSREVVAYRISQLRKRKIITGFLTLLDPRKLGFMTFNVLLKLVKVTHEEKMIEDLISREEITILSACSGRYDLAFDVTTRSLEEFEAFINNFLQEHASAVREYVILNFLREDPAGNMMIFDEPSSELLQEMNIAERKGSAFAKEFGERDKLKPYNGVIKIDDTDRQILSLLKFNARATLKEISDQVRVAPNSVKLRMGNLVSQGVIKSFTPLVSFSALGHQWFTVFLNLVGVKDSRLYSYAEQHNNIEWCVKCIGQWNYQLSIFARDNKEFHRVLNEVRDEFKEGINYYDSILIFNQYKFEPRVE